MEPLPARRRRSAALARLIIGIAAFSKPTNAALAVPIVAAALLRRDWRTGAGATLAFVLSCGGLFGLNLATSGEANYQGGERATYYAAKGFPFMTAAAPTASPSVQTKPEPGGGAVGLTRGRDERAARDHLLAQQPGRGVSREPGLLHVRAAHAGWCRTSSRAS